MGFAQVPNQTHIVSDEKNGLFRKKLNKPTHENTNSYKQYASLNTNSYKQYASLNTTSYKQYVSLNTNSYKQYASLFN